MCGDGWSLFEAGVVCRELGLGYAQNALQTDFFGGNRSSLALSGVRCHGSERSLIDCLHDRFGAVTCPGSKDNIAAVVCASGMSSSRLFDVGWLYLIRLPGRFMLLLFTCDTFSFVADVKKAPSSNGFIGPSMYHSYNDLIARGVSSIVFTYLRVFLCLTVTRHQ